VTFFHNIFLFVLPADVDDGSDDSGSGSGKSGSQQSSACSIL
jgi:hypothetical protein